MIESENKVTQISAGAVHTLFLSSSETVYGLGDSKHGQLGSGPSQFRKVDFTLGEGQVVSSVKAGSFFSMALIN